MKKYLSLAICLLVTILTHSQGTFEAEFSFSNNDESGNVIQNYDGNYTFTGTVLNGTGTKDIVVSSIDSAGNILQSNSYGTSSNEEANYIFQLPDSGYVVVGSTQGTTLDVLVMRINKNGNLIWSNTYGNPTHDYATKVVLTPDGDLCVLAVSLSSSFSEVAYALRIDLLGNLIWSNTYEFSYNSGFNDVAFDSNGDYIVAGINSIYGLLMKLDKTDGTIIWSNNYGTSPGAASWKSIVPTSDGGYLIAGENSGISAGVKDISLMKTDNFGNIEWFKAYGGISDETNAQILPFETSYIISATTESYGNGLKDGLIMNVSSEGALLWTKTYGNVQNNSVVSIIETNDNGLMFSGNTIPSSGGNPTIWLGKLNVLGANNCFSNPITLSVTDGTPVVTSFLPTILAGGPAIPFSLNTVGVTPSIYFSCEFETSKASSFQKVLGTPGLDTSPSITEAVDGGIFVCASFSPGPFGDFDFFVSRLNPQGDTLWTGIYGNVDSDNVKDLVATPDGGVIVVGNSTESFVENTFAAKISANGQLEWMTRYSDATQASRIIASNDGNYWIATRVLGNIGVLKIDPNGTLLWSNGYVSGSITGLIETVDNHLIICGFNDVLGVQKGLLLKITTNGSFVWAKEYGGSSSNEVILGLSADENAYYTFGASTINSSSYDALIVKFDTTGNILWSNIYPEYAYESFADGIVDNGNLIVSGYINGPILCSISPISGTMTWGKIYGDWGGDGGRLIKSYDGGYAAINTKNDFTNGSYDTYLVKTDNLGYSSNCHEADATFPYTTVTLSSTSISPSITSTSSSLSGSFNQKYGIAFYLDPEVSASSSVIDVQCFGGADGSIDLTTIGGVAPYTINWNNVVSPEDISNLTSGQYTLQISDALGCTFKDTLTVQEPSPINIVISSTDVSCSGGGDGSANASVTGGTAPYIYLWSIGQQDSTAIGLFEGTYIINVVDNNGCFGSNLVQVSGPSPLNLSFTITDATCGSSDGSVEAIGSGGTSPYSYSWSNGVNTAINNNIDSGPYSVVATDNNGCIINENIMINTVTNPVEMCVITVDSTSTKNVIAWEKPIVGNIAGFYVYRNIVGAYSQIGFVPYDSLSVFTDNSFGIDPNVTSYRYKISVLDTCGNESALSSFHETIHLSVNTGNSGEVNLIWDNYEGFNFNYYRILRDSTGTNNWEVLDSVGSTSFIWTDNNVPTIGADYLIEIVMDSTCTATKAQTFGNTRSNRRTSVAPGGPTSIEELILSEVAIYPNPNNGLFTVQIQSDNWEYALFDMSGKLIATEQILENIASINMENVETGIYMIRIAVGDSFVFKKIAKE